jgi:hypothetical protein
MLQIVGGEKHGISETMVQQTIELRASLLQIKALSAN